jgi:hypothetical protein
MRASSFFGIGLCISLFACSHADSTRSPASATAEPTGEIDERFVDDVKQAFAEYKAWGRVDDEVRWAPFLCRMPEPGRPTMSAANDGGHAKKLYSLFAKEHAAYAALGSSTPPTASATVQIIAKESYLPEAVATAPPPPSTLGAAEGDDHFHPYTTSPDGKTYRAGQMVGVYFVIEKPAGTPGTDEGFIYGTVTATGAVTSAGRVSSCMGCHAQAKHRRLFGPARPTL